MSASLFLWNYVMANEWYYIKAGQQKGPVSFEGLTLLVQTGKLDLTDHVWKQGMEKWAPASKINGLFSTAPATLPTEGKRSGKKNRDATPSGANIPPSPSRKRLHR